MTPETTGAQQALRVTMEEYGLTTKFALACNQSTKVIEAIQSRCAMLGFGGRPKIQDGRHGFGDCHRSLSKITSCAKIDGQVHVVYSDLDLLP